MANALITKLAFLIWTIFFNLVHNKIKLFLPQWDTYDGPVGWDLSNENNDNENMMEGIIKTMEKQKKEQQQKTKQNDLWQNVLDAIGRYYLMSNWIDRQRHHNCQKWIVPPPPFGDRLQELYPNRNICMKRILATTQTTLATTPMKKDKSSKEERQTVGIRSVHIIGRDVLNSIRSIHIVGRDVLNSFNYTSTYLRKQVWSKQLRPQIFTYFQINNLVIDSY